MPKRTEVAPVEEINPSRQIGELVKQLRGVRGVSQAALAEKCDRLQSWVSKMETGGETTNMTLRTLVEVMKGLDAQVVLAVTVKDTAGEEQTLEVPLT